MQKYILYGDPNEVAKVIQENRLRVERGSIKLEPAQPETVDFDSIDAKNEQIAKLADAVNQLAESHGALNQLASDLVAIIVTSGQNIPDDMADKLNAFGVFVPETTESVPDVTDTKDPAEPMEDDKTVEVEDMAEINLDDVKDAPAEDSKEVPQEDTKEAAAPATKKTRAKKSQ